MRRRALAALIAWTATLVAPGAAALAPPGPVSISVSGGPGEVVLAPGQQGTTSFIVRNPASYPQRVEIETSGLSVRAGAYDFDGKPPSALEVTVSPDRFLLDAGGAQQITVLVHTPLDTAVGGLYAGVIVRGIPDAPSGQAPVVGEIGLPLLVRVPGATDDTGRIVSFRPQRPSYDSAPVAFVVAFENLGKVHYSAAGTVELFSGGRSLGTVSVDSQVVLPSTIRSMITVWQGAAPSGDLRAHLALSWGIDGRHHGTQETVVTIAAPGTGEERSRRLAIASAPVAVATGGLALAVLLLILALARRRRRRRECAEPETGSLVETTR